VNDVLLDEFNIPQCNKAQFEEDPLDPLHTHKLLQHLITNPPFLKYIEFDDAGADALDVVLRIHNDDNNYANGFMSKYTYIVLSDIYLLSKKVLENIDKLNNNFKFSHSNWLKYNPNIVDFYDNSHRPQIITNFVGSMACNFPGIQIKPGENLGAYRIGSSGYFHLTLKKKLGFWRPSTDRRWGYWRMVGSIM
jgi:hypothetical protein